MGLHKVCGRGTTFRMKRAHLRHNENGGIEAFLPIRKGEEVVYNFSDDTCTIAGKPIQIQRKLKNITEFESFAYRYIAEHDV